VIDQDRFIPLGKVLTDQKTFTKNDQDFKKIICISILLIYYTQCISPLLVFFTLYVKLRM
jgi:hypothetical protein